MRNFLHTYKTQLTSIALVVWGGTLSTTVLASDFNYIQVHGMQATYGDIPGFDLRGAEIRAGFGRNRLFTEFRYRNLDDKSGQRKLEDERWNISLGYAWPVSSSMKIDLRANYGSIKLEGSGPNEYAISKPKYEGLSSYIHYAVSDSVKLYGGLEWQNLPENADQKAYHLGARYQFGVVSVGAEYTKYSDTDAISLFARYQF